MSVDFSGKIYPGITGGENADWQSKLEEVNSLGLAEAAVFIERFNRQERENLYKFLLRSSIKKVPLVHLRHDASKDELEFFFDNFRTRHFNIHEESFNFLDQWKGYEDRLYLEMDYDSKIAKNVKVGQIGGFCLDLSHFKASLARGSQEAYYVFVQKQKISCNHLSGYSESLRQDVHIVKDKKEFDYLATLPKYAFGEIIALEIDNSIKEQLEYKKYIVQMLNEYFSK